MSLITEGRRKKEDAITSMVSAIRNIITSSRGTIPFLQSFPKYTKFPSFTIDFLLLLWYRIGESVMEKLSSLFLLPSSLFPLPSSFAKKVIWMA